MAGDGDLGAEPEPAKSQTVTLSILEIVAKSSPPVSPVDKGASPSNESKTNVPSDPGSGTLRDQLSQK